MAEHAVLVSLFAALAVAALATPLIGAASRAGGLLDYPDSLRKRHSRAVPRVGGAGIFVAFLTPLVLVALDRSLLGAQPAQSLHTLVGLYAGGTLVFVAGLIDDLLTLGAWAKLGAQVCGGLVAFFHGYRITVITNPLGDPIVLGALSLPVTLLWIVTITNAINLIDGVDGVASGVVVFATSATLVFALVIGNDFNAVFLAALVGANIGFLFYNVGPATIFMGDSGSQFCGFVLSLLTLAGSQKSSAAVTLFLPVVILGLPITDTVFSVLRRSRNGGSIFRADTGHIHHRLIRTGFTPRQVMYLFYGVSLLLGTAGLVLTAAMRLHAALALLGGGLVFVLLVRVAEVVRRRGRGPHHGGAETAPPADSDRESARRAS